MTDKYECGVTEYVLIGRGYIMGVGGVETTIYCTNVPFYVAVDELQTLVKWVMDSRGFDFRISTVITKPVMEDDVDVTQSIFDLRHTVSKESVDFTFTFTGVAEFTFTAGYQEP